MMPSKPFALSPQIYTASHGGVRSSPASALSQGKEREKKEDDVALLSPADVIKAAA